MKPIKQEATTETCATSVEREREVHQNMHMKVKSSSRSDCETSIYSNCRWFKITGFKAIIWKQSKDYYHCFASKSFIGLTCHQQAKNVCFKAYQIINAKQPTNHEGGTDTKSTWNHIRHLIILYFKYNCRCWELYFFQEAKTSLQNWRSSFLKESKN